MEIDMTHTISDAAMVATANPSRNETLLVITPVSTRATQQMAIDEPDYQHSQIERPEVQYPVDSRFFFICGALALVLTLGGLDGNIVATAAPAIADHFHTVADIGWYAAAYRLSSCALQLLFGRLYKIFAARTVLLATVLIFLIGSTLCAAATSSPMFVVGRAVSGAGFAGINAGYLAVSCRILPLRKRPVFNGFMAGIESISVIAAPILGGVLTQHLSWRWCFWINLPIGFLAFLAILFALPSERVANLGRPREVLSQLDPVGNLVFIPCLTCLFVALSWAGTRYSWSDVKIIGLMIAFTILLAIYAVDQYFCKENATLPARVLRNRNVIAGFIFATCTNGSEAVLEYYLPTYFQVVRGSTPAESGYMMLPILGGFLIGLLLQGSGTTMIGYYTPFMILASILMPVASGLVTTWQVESSTSTILTMTGFAGFSTGIGFQGPQSAVQTSLPDADASIGLAIVLFAQGLGPAVFLSAAQSIFTNRLATNLQKLDPSLDLSTIQNVGLGELKASVGEGHLDRIVIGLNQTLTQTWYLIVATTCTTMIGSLLTDWRSVKEKRQ